MIKHVCDNCGADITSRDMVYGIKVVRQENARCPIEQWKFGELCEKCYLAVGDMLEGRKSSRTEDNGQTQILWGTTYGTLTYHHCLVGERWVMIVTARQYVNDTPRAQRLPLPGGWMGLTVVYNSSGLTVLCDEGDLVIVAPDSQKGFNGLIVLGEEHVGDGE